MAPLEIKLGNKYRDTITKFEGFATAYLKNLSSEDMVMIENSKSHRWFEVNRLETSKAE